jgi:SpoVK/Ycf46/Vps4 family AAA+-type ATPase
MKQNLIMEWCLCLHLPSLLIDALVGSRGHRERGVQERVLSALLTEMDGIGVHRDSLSALCHFQVIISNTVVMDYFYKCSVVSAFMLYLVGTNT